MCCVFSPVSIGSLCDYPGGCGPRPPTEVDLGDLVAVPGNYRRWPAPTDLNIHRGRPVPTPQSCTPSPPVPWSRQRVECAPQPILHAPSAPPPGAGSLFNRRWPCGPVRAPHVTGNASTPPSPAAALPGPEIDPVEVDARRPRPFWRGRLLFAYRPALAPLPAPEDAHVNRGCLHSSTVAARVGDHPSAPPTPRLLARIKAIRTVVARSVHHLHERLQWTP